MMQVLCMLGAGIPTRVVTCGLKVHLIPIAEKWAVPATSFIVAVYLMYRGCLLDYIPQFDQNKLQQNTKFSISMYKQRLISPKGAEQACALKHSWQLEKQLSPVLIRLRSIDLFSAKYSFLKQSRVPPSLVLCAKHE